MQIAYEAHHSATQALTNWPVVLAIVAIVVAVAAGALGVWAARRYGNRRGKILLTWEYTPLMPSIPEDASGKLRVTYNDAPVTEPHLVLLRLQNVGSKDLTSGDFNEKQSLPVNLNCRVEGLLTSNRPQHVRAVQIEAPAPKGLIEIAPLLLKRRQVLAVTAIVSGRPRIEVEPDSEPLINVDIIDKRSFDSETARSLAKFAVRVLLGSTPVLGGSVLSAWDGLNAALRPDD